MDDTGGSLFSFRATYLPLPLRWALIDIVTYKLHFYSGFSFFVSVSVSQKHDARMQLVLTSYSFGNPSRVAGRGSRKRNIRRGVHLAHSVQTEKMHYVSSSLLRSVRGRRHPCAMRL